MGYNYENDACYTSESYRHQSVWKRESNCFGYALGIKRWVCVSNWGRLSNKAIAKRIEEAFNLIPVKKQDMVEGKEYFAIRFSPHKDDYHFMWRGKKGHWRHKMGGSPVEAISQKEVFGKAWLRRYKGHIYLYEYDRNSCVNYLDAY